MRSGSKQASIYGPTDRDRPLALSLSPDDDDGQSRSCAECDGPLPADSRGYRRFCSTACRVRHWDLANRQTDEGWPLQFVALHWHAADVGSLLLYGYVANGYWRGPEGCPPNCPGLQPPYTKSYPVPEGREGLPPRAETI